MEGGPAAVDTGESVSLQFEADGSLSVAYGYGGIDLSSIRLAQTDLEGALFADFVVKQGQVRALEKIGITISSIPEMGIVVVCIYFYRS